MHGGYLTKPQYYAACNKSRRERYASDPEFRARRIIGRKKRTSDYQKRLRIRAMNIISNNVLKCANCGIGDTMPEILEINHKNCDGNKERPGGNFWRAIIRGTRKTDDLEILCKVCDIAHYMKFKFAVDWFKYIKDGTLL